MILNKNSQFQRLSLQQSHHPSIFDAPIQKSSKKKPIITIETQGSPRVNHTIDTSKDSEEINDIKHNQTEDINLLKATTKDLSE